MNRLIFAELLRIAVALRDACYQCSTATFKFRGGAPTS
jgi:hypothetical protein